MLTYYIVVIIKLNLYCAFILIIIVFVMSFLSFWQERKTMQVFPHSFFWMWIHSTIHICSYIWNIWDIFRLNKFVKKFKIIKGYLKERLKINKMQKNDEGCDGLPNTHAQQLFGASGRWGTSNPVRRSRNRWHRNHQVSFTTLYFLYKYILYIHIV